VKVPEVVLIIKAVKVIRVPVGVAVPSEADEAGVRIKIRTRRKIRARDRVRRNEVLKRRFYA
jgi:hypothetical protein